MGRYDGRKRRRLVRAILLAMTTPLAMVGGLGCPYYSITAEDALENLYYQRPFLRDEPSEAFQQFQTLNAAVDDHLREIDEHGSFVTRQPEALAESAGCSEPIRFLHLSDSQVRDETLYRNAHKLAQVGFWDWLVPVSLRRPNVETEDSLTLAAFLVAHGKEATNSDGSMTTPPFVVHTGDLLDVSATSELIETLSVFRYVKAGYSVPIFSLGGNHDGLTFGNISDNLADMRGLGVNKSEFVVAHLVADRDSETGRLPTIESGKLDAGFGFAGNEILRAAALPDASKRLNDGGADFDCEHDCRRKLTQLYGAIEALQTAANDVPLGLGQAPPPVVYQTAIHIPDDTEDLPLHLGYYSWSASPQPGSHVGFRFIALDTRGKNQANGEIDDVQFGWLYDQLVQADAAREAVVVFAHHEPCDIRTLYVLPSGKARLLESLLAGFPNVVAYFHGHAHWNEPEPANIQKHGVSHPAMIQTGSLADYPQVGREVAICTSEGNATRPDTDERATIAWSFVRPAGIHPARPDRDGTRKLATEMQEDKQNADETPRQELSTEGRGSLLSALLFASQSDAEKEYRTSFHWWWKFHEVGHAMFPWWIPPFVAFDAQGFRAEALRPNRLTVPLRFAHEGCPTAQSLFGKARLEELQAFRQALGLKTIRTSCEPASIPHSSLGVGAAHRVAEHVP